MTVSDQILDRNINKLARKLEGVNSRLQNIERTPQIRGGTDTTIGDWGSIAFGSVTDYMRGDKTWATLDKAAVGLGSVPNVDATNAANISSGVISTARLGTGTANSTKYLRGDSTWQTLDASTVGAEPSSTFTAFGRTLVGYLNAGTFVAGLDLVTTTAFTASPSSYGAEPTIFVGSTSQYFRGDKSWQTLNKAAVGLGNVDNTADASKAFTASQTTSGTFNEARLGSGTGTSAKYLRGDSTWQTLNLATIGAADDALVVHKAGTETISGAKTFTTSPVHSLPVINVYQGSQPFSAGAGNAVGPYFAADGLPYFVTPSGVAVPFSIGEVGTALHSNPSFENQTAGVPDNWSFFWQNGGSVATETTDVLFGARSVKVNTTAVALNNQVVMSTVFTVAAGDTVTVGGWAHKITGSPKFSIGFISGASGTPDFFDGVSFGSESDPEALFSNFIRYTKSFQVPAGHTVGRFFFRFGPTAAEACSSILDFTTSSRAGASTTVLPGNAWPKEACRVAATANVTNVGTSAPSSVDGVSVAVGDRVLVPFQTSQATNGIYTVTVVGTGSNGTWLRASDAATGPQVAGAAVSVLSGTLYGGTNWSTMFKSTDSFGVTAMVWTLNRNDTGWITPSYATNWGDVGGGFQARRYRRIGSMVRLEGYALRASTSSGATATILTLPSGFRPLASQVIQMSQNSGGVISGNQVYVDSSGNVIVSNSVAAGVAVPIYGEFYVD